MTKAEIAEATGLAKGTVISRYHSLTRGPKRGKRRITPEQDALILANFNRMTKRELGAVVGLPENTVHARYRDLMLRREGHEAGVRLTQAYATPSLPRLRFLENP